MELVKSEIAVFGFSTAFCGFTSVGNFLNLKNVNWVGMFCTNSIEMLLIFAIKI